MPSLYALTALPFTLLLIARLSTFTLAFPTGPIRRRSANRITRLHDSNSFSKPFPSPRPRVSFLFRMCRGIAQGTEDTVFEIGIRKWEEERYRERDPCPPPPPTSPFGWSKPKESGKRIDRVRGARDFAPELAVSTRINLASFPPHGSFRLCETSRGTSKKQKEER